jgi:hypothetical protein
MIAVAMHEAAITEGGNSENLKSVNKSKKKGLTFKCAIVMYVK